MGGRGGRLHGISQTAPRVRPVVTQAPTVQTPTVQAPVATGVYDAGAIAQLSDSRMATTFNKIFTQTKFEANQQDTDTQRFFNAIGWADRTPRILDNKHFEGARKAARAISLYHTDAPCPGTPDAQTLADQYMHTGKQYISGGVHGDGTYFATTASGSWGYGNGTRNSTQFKAFLSSRAKVVDEVALKFQLRTWGQAHPKAYKALRSCAQGYYKSGGSVNGSLSIFAAMNGYNVIKSGSYYTILDRSATTVCGTTRRGGGSTQDW